MRATCENVDPRISAPRVLRASNLEAACRRRRIGTRGLARRAQQRESGAPLNLLARPTALSLWEQRTATHLDLSHHLSSAWHGLASSSSSAASAASFSCIRCSSAAKEERPAALQKPDESLMSK
ncbi:unnamed protein product [Prorocentrum cordatum]|uniref:Uncharacterized protein n=1 Tax=Prorocentrum cordatum TaxID=2364126 RepID=A0ABN9TVE1_9DINO|nr:unnamed protein product [Polarella glacialis]